MLAWEPVIRLYACVRACAHAGLRFEQNLVDVVKAACLEGRRSPPPPLWQLPDMTGPPNSFSAPGPRFILQKTNELL